LYTGWSKGVKRDYYEEKKKVIGSCKKEKVIDNYI